MPDRFSRQSSEVPEGAFTKCSACSAILYTKDFERDLKVCSRCGHHHPLTADERIATTADEGTFVEFGNDFLADDPLLFPGYAAKLELGYSSEPRRNDGLVTGTPERLRLFDDGSGSGNGAWHVVNTLHVIY